MRLAVAPAVYLEIEWEFSVLPKLAKAGECDTGYQVDALLIELCPGYRAPVHAFYADGGPPLREMHSRAELRALDSYLAMVVTLRSRWRSVA